MSEQKDSRIGSSGLLTQIDRKIKSLAKTKEELDKKSQQIPRPSLITARDLERIDFSDELSKIKEVQRERLLEDMSQILNDKIKELEQKENAELEKEKVLENLTNALNEKVFQLEISNRLVLEQKKRSDKLNAELHETIKKLNDAEKELKIERDWLADQVEKKSLEVLTVIDQLIKAENK